ncbi:hypothetical protein I316_05878 [Kwoniella heveanensis BCC8398]|uniref:Uncharacterized protein n=1 Tax=Kwoniella heveanensis BCC8398 TaxID=1296120 RepID=A0A1B9GN32_9TREE|nr:hypothetical protein I316_05878 [Kwoniella heveanensis BCC8398]
MGASWASLIPIWVSIYLLLLRSKPPPSREEVITPNEERVVLLGSSSGVGRDLAHAYAKRGAKICLVARRADVLDKVKQECLEQGAKSEDILVVAADITQTDDLLRVREAVEKAWSGFDTLHILAGLPSTSLLLDLAGVSLNKPEQNSGSGSGSGSGSSLPSGAPLRFSNKSPTEDEQLGPSRDGLQRVADEARALSEVNYVGTVLALACFLPLLASTSRSPAVHHLSSVAATVPAPHRVIYAATKAAGLAAVESCRVECEGCGVRFFSFCPGTIDNEFRLKTASAQTGGRDETKMDIKHAWEGLLLQPETVCQTILHHLSLFPQPVPLIPYPPFSWIPSLRLPPKHLVHAPWQYRLAMIVRDTPLGWMYIEPGARKKYGLIGRP